ncbi:MAG: hypothetical protein JNK82_31345 [Myxococcaceae bacterium]|nr:hypothetical protein [Myxococcaceae bacterium]
MRLLLVLVFVTVGSAAHAQMLQDMTPPQHRLVHRQVLVLRVNPLGLLYDGRFMYRFRLYGSDRPALRDNFIGVGIAPGASPAFGRIGAYVEFQPASFIGFWSVYEYVQYFSTFNLLQGWRDAQDNFSDTAIRERSNERFMAGGTQWTLGMNLQAKVGVIVGRALFRWVRPDFALKPGDAVEYDQFYDTLMPNRGWAMFGDVDIFAQLPIGLIAGARTTFAVPFYGPQHLDPSQPAPNNAHVRVGPAVGWQFFTRDGAGLNNPTLFLLIQWWAMHRYRTGADTSAALPCITLAFTMTGDFFDVGAKPVSPTEEPKPAPTPISPER